MACIQDGGEVTESYTFGCTVSRKRQWATRPILSFWGLKVTPQWDNSSSKVTLNAKWPHFLSVIFSMSLWGLMLFKPLKHDISNRYAIQNSLYLLINCSPESVWLIYIFKLASVAFGVLQKWSNYKKVTLLKPILLISLAEHDVPHIDL